MADRTPAFSGHQQKTCPEAEPHGGGRQKIIIEWSQANWDYNGNYAHPLQEATVDEQAWHGQNMFF